MKRTVQEFDYSPDTEKLAGLAKAIAHPARIIILKHLSKQNACYNGDFLEILPLAQATVSQHIKALKDVGIITGEVNPPKVKYCIDQEKWEEAKKLFDSVFKQDFHSFQCCSTNDVLNQYDK